MTVFIDAEYRCHVSDDGTMLPVETDAFNGMSDEYIEGFRLIPEGHTWVREDGIHFTGEMIAPHKDYVELLGKQLLRDQAKLADAENALAIMYGGIT